LLENFIVKSLEIFFNLACEKNSSENSTLLSRNRTRKISRKYNCCHWPCFLRIKSFSLWS